MSPEELIERIREKVAEFQQRMNDLLDSFNAAVEKVARFFGWAAERAVDLWNGLVVPLWQKVVDWAGEHLNVMGAPWAMYAAANDWRTGVGTAVTRWSGTVTTETSDVDLAWKGTSSERYVQRSTQQATALKQVGPIAEKVAGALDAVALAIVVWWGSIATALVALIAGILLAAASTATGPGAVVGIPLGAKLAIAGFIGALLVGTGVLTATAAVQKGTLTGAFTDMSAFPGGHWPTFA